MSTPTATGKYNILLIGNKLEISDRKTWKVRWIFEYASAELATSIWQSLPNDVDFECLAKTQYECIEYK